ISRVSDSNPIAVPQRTSLIVFDPDIFNCSRQVLRGQDPSNLVGSYLAALWPEGCQSAAIYLTGRRGPLPSGLPGRCHGRAIKMQLGCRPPTVDLSDALL